MYSVTGRPFGFMEAKKKKQSSDESACSVAGGDEQRASEASCGVQSADSFDLTKELFEYAKHKFAEKRSESFLRKVIRGLGNEDLGYMEAMLEVMQWSYERSKQLRKAASTDEATTAD